MVTHGRHDPCVGIRATPIAEAMLALVLMDHACVIVDKMPMCASTPAIPGAAPGRRSVRLNPNTRTVHASAAAGRNHAAATGLGIGLYLRLSGFYLVYFAILGVPSAVLGTVFAGAWFDPARIGELMAIPQATKTGGADPVGLAGGSQWPLLRIVRGACLAAVVLFATACMQWVVRMPG